MDQNTQLNENSAEVKLDGEGEPINPSSKKPLNQKVIVLILVAVLLVIVGIVYFIFFNKEDNRQLSPEENVEILEDEEIVDVEIDKNLDSDQDLLPDYLEKILGTDENNSDTDGDSYDDYNEIKNGYNPSNTEKYTEEEFIVVKELIRDEDEGLFVVLFNSSDEDPGWRKYQNKEYGYEIKYPSEWKGFYENEQTDSVFFLERETKLEDAKQAISENNGFWIYQYENLLTDTIEWSGGQNDRALSLQEINIQISGITPIVYEENLSGIIYYLIPRNKEVYVFVSSMDKEIVYQILSTFQFIKRDDEEFEEIAFSQVFNLYLRVSEC